MALSRAGNGYGPLSDKPYSHLSDRTFHYQPASSPSGKVDPEHRRRLEQLPGWSWSPHANGNADSLVLESSRSGRAIAEFVEEGGNLIVTLSKPRFRAVYYKPRTALKAPPRGCVSL